MKTTAKACLDSHLPCALCGAPHYVDLSDPKELLWPNEVAKILKCSVSKLEKMRCDKRGPVFVKPGGRIFYPRLCLMDWIRAQARTSTKSGSKGLRTLPLAECLYDEVEALPISDRLGPKSIAGIPE